MAAVHMPQSEPASPPIIATYRLQCDPGQADAVARFVAFEQTVELPERLVTDATLLREIVGEVRDLRADGPGHAIARIAFNAELASGQLSQLLNLLYGNVSMASGIRLVDVDLPDTLLQRFNGPRHGIDGVRALLGVYDRPLLATAVKPRGLSDETLAHLVGRFALGGGDIVNVTSLAGRKGGPETSAYSASKHAANSMTDAMRQELGNRNIRVSILMPGATETEVGDSISNPQWRAAIQAHVSKDGAVQPSEIGETIVFMLSLPRHVNISEISVRPTIDTTA